MKDRLMEPSRTLLPVYGASHRTGQWKVLFSMLLLGVAIITPILLVTMTQSARAATISIPVVQNDRLKGIEELRNKGVGEITVALEIFNPATRHKCESACYNNNNFGTTRESCIHECYWETGWWTSKCSPKRYC